MTPTLQQTDLQQEVLLLTTVQLANQLGCSERTILNMRKRYNLPHYRIGRSIRYDKQAVLKVLSGKQD